MFWGKKIKTLAIYAEEVTDINDNKEAFEYCWKFLEKNFGWSCSNFTHFFHPICARQEGLKCPKIGLTRKKRVKKGCEVGATSPKIFHQTCQTLCKSFHVVVYLYYCLNVNGQRFLKFFQKNQFWLKKSIKLKSPKIALSEKSVFFYQFLDVHRKMNILPIKKRFGGHKVGA